MEMVDTESAIRTLTKLLKLELAKSEGERNSEFIKMAYIERELLECGQSK
jgi:hypothetical protein